MRMTIPAPAHRLPTLDYILKLNEDPGSIFYHNIDTDHIGIAGHSQGGPGAYNAVTKQENGYYYKAIFTASSTSSFWGRADKLGTEWSYDLSNLSIPTLMVAGTRAWDAGSTADKTAESGQSIAPLWSLTENFEAIPDSTPKVMAREKDKDHGDMLRYADGYMTAWFMYWLKGDEEAGKAFFGEEPEISRNKNWQNVRIGGR